MSASGWCVFNSVISDYIYQSSTSASVMMIWVRKQEDSRRQTCTRWQRMLSVEAVKGHRQRQGAHEYDTCLICIMNDLGNFLGTLCRPKFHSSNVIGERKKNKAQVELLQLRIPPNPKKKESPETKQRCQRNTDPLLIFWNSYLR